jgi:hypothetical protein
MPSDNVKISTCSEPVIRRTMIGLSPISPIILYIRGHKNIHESQILVRTDTKPQIP